MYIYIFIENPRKTAEATTNETITSREGGEKINTAGDSNNIAAQTFTFRELAAATKNFRQEYLLGEGGFGRVYKGRLDKTDQVIYYNISILYIHIFFFDKLSYLQLTSLLIQLVAVKQLDRNGLQGNREFLVEVLMLSFLHHQNLVSLIGYCADGEQRLLVYEYMQLGSLEDHLLGIYIYVHDFYTLLSCLVNAY